MRIYNLVLLVGVATFGLASTAHEARACQATDDFGNVTGGSGNSAHCTDNIANTQDICVSPTIGDFSSNGCLATHPTVFCTSDTCNSRVLSGPGWNPKCTSTAINNGGTCVDGNAGTYDDRCSNGSCSGTTCSACAPGNYVSTACGTANTVCAACSTCGAGTYASAACTGTANTVCSTCTAACGATAYESQACTATTNRNCVTCSSNCSACTSASACTCSAGFGNCNGGTDGCETATTSAIANCGACGTVCSAPTNGTATCASSTCGFTCNTGYKKCGAACIPTATCCTAADCTTPDQCHTATGATCPAAGGACTYPNKANGTTCSDGNACNLNDVCTNGVCAGSGTVTCVKVDCKSTSCMPASGCTATNLPDQSDCGGNGCYAAGKCVGGVCPGTPKDCSAKSSECGVGVCDAMSAAGDCASINKANGTTCNNADKCLIDTQCMAGACTGVPKSCTSSGVCRVATCDSASGDCSEALAAPGTSCAPTDTCATAGECNAEGSCAPSTGLPDGTPCEIAGCTLESRCFGSVCTCGAPLDMTSEGADMGAVTTPPDEGCAMGGHGSPTGLLLGLMLLGLALVRRRLAA